MELVLPRTLVLGDEAGRTRAIEQLSTYFAPLIPARTVNSSRLNGYTGGQWDTFDPSGTRQASANHFTCDDIVACSLLSVDIDGNAALQLLDNPVFSALLAEIGPDQDLAGLASLEEPPFRAVRALYAEVRSLPRVGETRATKLLARKRPRLVPIVDAVVRQTVFARTTTQWAALHEALRADDLALHRHLLGLRDEAGLPEEVSALRVFDVLAWMAGKDIAAAHAEREER